MLEYRMYFLGRNDHIVARHEYESEHDGEALHIALILADACSDVTPRFMLWCGGRLVWEPPPDAKPFSPPVPLKQCAPDVQARVLDHEERIKSSHFRIANSKRLLRLMDELKAPSRTSST